MAINLYNPFESLQFNPEECFLTAKKINSTQENMAVFPEWLINRYALKDKTFTMLDQNMVKSPGSDITLLYRYYWTWSQPIIRRNWKGIFGRLRRRKKSCRNYTCFSGWPRWYMVFYTTILLMLWNGKLQKESHSLSLLCYPPNSKTCISCCNRCCCQWNLRGPNPGPSGWLK